MVSTSSRRARKNFIDMEYLMVLRKGLRKLLRNVGRKVKAVLVLSQFEGSVVRWYERYPTILPTNPRNPRRQQAFRTLRGEYFVYAVELRDIGHVSTEHNALRIRFDILHTALNIAREVTCKEFSMRPEYEVIGDESRGRVDYAIKKADPSYMYDGRQGPR